MRCLITGASGFIGTNLVEYLARKGVELLNFDINRPLNSEHQEFWKRGDILDYDALISTFIKFQPVHVIHMAARTDCVERVNLYEEYDVNITGTKNVLEAVKATPSVERVIITSSQYVCGPAHYPQDMDDYGPHTVYGQSKVLTEKLTKKAGLLCTWTIIRPENVWGPWHIRYRSEAWNVIRKGFYVHPAGKPVTRCYGYVGNVIWQIEQILNAPREKMHMQVFYVGDCAIDIYDWVNGFSKALTGKPARKVPRLFLRCIGLAGDVITSITGKKFALTSSRYQSMTQDYLTPVQQTFDIFGSPPYSLKDGVNETVKWLNEYGWP